MDAKHWKKEHTDFLLGNYESMSFKELSENLERSIESIRSKLKRLGFSKDPKKSIVKNTIIVKSLIGKAASPAGPGTKKRAPKMYESVNQDLNRMIPVQIDHKTTIYIKEGKDPAEARQRYLERISERPKF
jgi:hypothetical protein